MSHCYAIKIEFNELAGELYLAWQPPAVIVTGPAAAASLLRDTVYGAVDALIGVDSEESVDSSDGGQCA